MKKRKIVYFVIIVEQLTSKLSYRSIASKYAKSFKMKLTEWDHVDVAFWGITQIIPRHSKTSGWWILDIIRSVRFVSMVTPTDRRGVGRAARGSIQWHLSRKYRIRFQRNKLFSVMGNILILVHHNRHLIPFIKKLSCL